MTYNPTFAKITKIIFTRFCFSLQKPVRCNKKAKRGMILQLVFTNQPSWLVLKQTETTSLGRSRSGSSVHTRVRWFVNTAAQNVCVRDFLGLVQTKQCRYYQSPKSLMLLVVVTNVFLVHKVLHRISKVVQNSAT